MELSPLPSSERAAQAKDDEEDEIDMLISDKEYSDVEVDHMGDFDLSKDIKPPPRWTCCGEISAGTLLRRLGYLCVVVVVLVAFFAMFTIPTPPEFGGVSKAATTSTISSPSSLKNSSSSSSSRPIVTPALSSLAPSTASSPTAAVSSDIVQSTDTTVKEASPVAAIPASSLISSSSSSVPIGSLEVDRKEMRQLAARLKPRDWNLTTTPKQFLHMHHMKTGGTSMDGLLSCAVSRWATLTGQDLFFYRVSECAGTVARCTESLARNDTASCPVHAAAVMSYCAALDAVDRFGWGDADKFTILRDPVDRVWSMYRFSLQGCYSCKTLPEVYAELDRGVVYSGICGTQLLNHQTENMLSAATRAHEANLTEQEFIDEAIENMNSRFAVIGLTGRFQESVKMITKVFPFLAENLTEVSNGMINDTVTCPIRHDNEGRPPSCGTRALDDDIRKIIIDHNQRDMQLYAAALVHFEKQKKILLDNENYDEEQTEMASVAGNEPESEDKNGFAEDPLGGAA